MAYSKEQVKKIFDKVCQRIEEGESLRSVLRDKDMPSSRTFFKWIDEDEEKVKQYARSTSIRADLIFDEILEISDNTIEGSVIHVKGDGTEEVRTGDMLGHRRLQVDARKWILSKMNPKKYGEKSELDLTSKGEKLNTTTTVEFVNARKESEKKK